MSHTATLDPNNSTNVRILAPTLLKRSCRLMSRLAPGMSSRAAARLFTCSHGVRENTARERLWLGDASPFELDCGGHTLAAWSWGDGPTVLLHHGWHGRGAQLGAFVAPLVEAGFSVVTYDAPAHGASPGRFTNGVEMARIIAEASRQLHGLHAVVAHSLGCLSTAYALRSHLPIERLVFVAPPADMVTYSRQFAAALGLTDRVYDGMIAHFESTLDMDWRDFEVERLAEADRLARGRQTPLLVIHDRDDLQAPCAHGQRLHAAWEGSRFQLTEGLGHNRILGDAGVVRRAVDFLAGP